MSVYVFTSDGANKLPPCNSCPVSVSFDCSALSRLTKPSEYSRDPDAQNIRKWLRKFAPEQLELIVGPAVIESVYKKSTARFVDLPFVQRCKLSQLDRRPNEVPEPRLHAQAVASTLMRVVGHVLNIIAMKEAYIEYGAKRDPATAMKRLEHFIRWAASAPQLGGTSIIAVAMHEALTFNTSAARAFGLESTKIDFNKLLNGAWDLYQLEFMLGFESSWHGKHPHAISVYLTCDIPLASVFTRAGLLDPANGLIGVDPVSMTGHPRICAASQGAIQHVRDLPETIEAFRNQANRLAETFGSFALSYDDKGLHNLHRRLTEAACSLVGHTEYLFQARNPTGCPRFRAIA